MARIKFECPASVIHEETRVLMADIVRTLNREKRLTALDLPQLHRMATSFDLYLTATEWLSQNDPVTTNKKGEEVKHPYVNIQREQWEQFLRIGREYGTTVKSRAQISSHKAAPKEVSVPSPIDKFISKK